VYNALRNNMTCPLIHDQLKPSMATYIKLNVMSYRTSTSYVTTEHRRNNWKLS